MGMENGTTTVENNLVISQTVKHKIIKIMSQQLHSYVYKRNEMCTKKLKHKLKHKCSEQHYCNSQKVEQPNVHQQRNG